MDGGDNIMENKLTQNGSDGRVYGGDVNLIHVVDGLRGQMGVDVADTVERLMRERAENRTNEEREAQALCPGCYMVVIFNAMLSLAERTGQDLKEMTRAMKGALTELEKDPTNQGLREEICIILDND
jgi:hypothetical protein